MSKVARSTVSKIDATIAPLEAILTPLDERTRDAVRAALRDVRKLALRDERKLRRADRWLVEKCGLTLAQVTR